MAEFKSIADMLINAARQDAAACVLLAASTSIGDAVVGFHAQQAIEKSLKAVLSRHNIEFRRTHDLLTLLDLLQDNGLPLPPGADWVDELNPYAVEARYGAIDPDGLDRSYALEVMQKVVDWAAALIA